VNALALVTALSLAGGPRVEGLVNAKDSLGSLNGFSVTVDLDDGAARAGIVSRAISTQIEAALRRSGVHVYRYVGNEVTNDPGTPGKEGQVEIAIVALTGSVGAEPFTVVRYDVVVSQWVHLEADPTAAAFARTWMEGGVLTAPRNQVAGVVREALAPALDKLCADYVSARAYWLARQRASAATGRSE
jgi:hypothetical protein